MFKLLSKLNAKDNVQFGNAIVLKGRERFEFNRLVKQRSRLTISGKKGCQLPQQLTQVITDFNSRENQTIIPQTVKSQTIICARWAFFSFLKSTVDQRWEIVEQNNRFRKYLRNHHTNVCKKENGTTCNKCTRRHHRSRSGNEASLGLRPVQKVKIKDKESKHVEFLAMIVVPTQVLFGRLSQRRGLIAPKVHLTMNSAGGQKKSKESELVNITVVSISEEAI